MRSGRWGSSVVPARAILGNLMRPKALLWGGALVVSGAIVANALFLQSSRHPSPFFAAARQERDLEVAKPDELVRALQDAMRRSGYYGGPLDGVAGPQTVSAIVAFERISGRDVTGKPSAELLDAVRDEAAGAAASGKVGAGELGGPGAVGSAAARPDPDPRVAKVQLALSRAAYGQIRADGVFGPQTRDAIKQFQADHNLPVTGEIDDGLLVELASAGALESE